MNKQTKKRPHYAWVVLLGVALMLGFTRGGLLNAGGQFLLPISKDLGISLTSISLYLSISSIVTVIFLPFAGKLLTKMNMKLLLIIGTIFNAGAFALLGFMNHVWGWYLLSIPIAMGSAVVAQLAGPVIINNWFVKSKGLALGMTMAVSSAFGAVIQPWIGGLIAEQGWRQAYIITGIVIAIGALVGIILFIKSKPADKGLLAYGYEESSDSNKEVAATKEMAGISASIAKKSLSFWSFFVFLFFLTSVTIFTIHLAPFSTSLGYDAKFSGSLLGIYMIGALLGALTFGFLTDKIGAKKSILTALTLGLVSFGMLITVSSNQILLMIAVVIFGFIASSVGTLSPLLTSALFGSKDYATIYSTAAIALAVAGIISLPAFSAIYDATGSYNFVLYTIAGMLVLCIILILVAFSSKEKLVQKGYWN